LTDTSSALLLVGLDEINKMHTSEISLHFILIKVAFDK